MGLVISMRNRKIMDIGVIALVTALALTMILTVVMTANPLLASQSTNATNSTVSINATSVSNVTMTNVTTCPPGLLTAIQANLYIDDMWLMRIGANMSGLNTTSLMVVNATGLMRLP